MNIEEVVYETASSTFSGLTLNEKANHVILCLHGWLDNAASFLPLFEQMNPDEEIGAYQVIAVDWPGHGGSSHRSEDAHYHFVDWVYDLLALIEANSWQNVHIVGHSMGGMIASAFAATFPEKIKSLTLIDSIGFVYGDEQECTSQLRKGMLSRLKQTKTAPSKVPNKELAVKARVLISDLEYEHAELIVTRNLRKTETGYQWRSDKRLNTISAYRLSLSQCKQLVSDIKVPVQVIYASKGLEFIRQGIDIFTPLMPCKNIVELEGGHHVHMEKPAETAKLIHTFITSV